MGILALTADERVKDVHLSEEQLRSASLSLPVAN